MTETTDTADHVIEQWADMFDEMMGLDDEAVDMVRQILGSSHFGLREAVEKLESIAAWGCGGGDADYKFVIEAKEALAALKGEGDG